MSPARTAPGLASVGYLFGTIGAQAVPGTVLVPLLTDLGMSVSAARTLLHRMREAGSLSAERIGRVAIYRLAGRYLAQYQGITFGGETANWSGAFDAILYDIPEVHRAERNRLRERAFAAGFGAPRSGLLIGVTDPDRWADTWLKREDLAVERVRLGCDLDTARRLADQAWGLAEIAADIEAFRDRIELIGRRVHNRQLTNHQALTNLYDLWQEFVRIQIQTPSLPAELYPEEWHLPEMRAEVYQVNAVLLPLAKQHTQAVIDEAAATTLVELEPRTPRSEKEGHTQVAASSTSSSSAAGTADPPPQ
ncbi:PaaX family transcriptional regulator C-terminal domain-containing protein [Arthrobacter sp. GMC3]|uniref:PaaX family transcriptional regulator C-terminal domain-containing protein n=1 Tax=Arthrobacter sp. GMC3 TaxID=2058894 RepID=UPI0011B0BC8E|nr:PaaX family transcriptional regulator C-terminal domain-containing protein [Arthrobacter sp. GMC3]